MNEGETRSFLDLFRFTKELTVQSFVIASGIRGIRADGGALKRSIRNSRCLN
jgi:hypothetical protein